MDRRQQKSRKAIIDAFTTLLSQKSYSRISVQEIIDLANIGRTTFYAHFETRDYLLKELCEGLFEHIIDFASNEAAETVSCPNCKKGESIFLHLINHLQNNDNRLLDLLSSSNTVIFQCYFKENLKKLVKTNYANQIQASPLPDDYLINHIAASFAETVDWWLRRYKKETQEEITNYFLATVEPILRQDIPTAKKCNTCPSP